MTEREHPLLNNVVVKEILKYSTVDDLAAHRLVNKTWFETSLARWRSTATLNILQRTQGSLDVHGATLKELRNIFLYGRYQSFLRMDTKPFAKYRLKKWKIEPLSRDTYYEKDRLNPLLLKPKTPNLTQCSKKEVICGAENFPSFWQKIGPLMRSLTMDDTEFGHHHHNPLLAIIFEHTPNLVALKVSRCAFPGNDYNDFNKWSEITKLEYWELEPKAALTSLAFDGSIPVLLEELLGYFPNLENLTLHRWDAMSGDRNAMRDIYCTKLTPNLKYLDILHDHDFTNNTRVSRMNVLAYELIFYRTAISCLREHRETSTGERGLLPLKTLELGSTDPIFQIRWFVECISETLDTYAEFGNLEIIKLYMAPFSKQTRDLKLTRMIESVKHFEVWGNCLQSLGFLRWMPNLESLEVHNSCFEKWDQMPQLKEGWTDHRGNVSKCFVTKINQDIVQNALQSHTEMNHYVGIHLKCLHIDYEFRDESLNTLSKWMPHLKDLKTILNNKTLRTVCGLWSDLEKLHLLYGSSVDDEGITGINQEKKKMGLRQEQKLNLTNLQKLKSFRLETYCGLSKLGDFSATEAFLKMQTLQFLEICVSSEMSVDAEVQLEKAIPNAKIIRNYGNEELGHRGYEKCCKRLQFLFESVEGAETAYDQSISNSEIRI